MFSELISRLADGHLPTKAELRPRFEAAIIKKMGVLKQPFFCRSSDKKINPSTKEMLWAAIVLEDRQDVDTVLAMIIAEEHDRGHMTNQTDHIVAGFVGEMVDLARDDVFRNILRAMAENYCIGAVFESS